MRHYLLTRFNLRLWPHNKVGEETQTEEWLRRRVALFETYTLPSVAAQTCQDFVWIILIDSDSPQWFLDKLRQWKDDCKQIKVISVKGAYSRAFARIFRDVMTKDLDGYKGPVISTYLDNDDAIARCFVSDVQRRLSGAKAKTVLAYTHGIQYFTQLKLATSIRFRHNHFISIIEKVDDLQSVFGYGSHYYIWKCPEISMLYDDSRNMWMEVVHEGNVDNDVWMTLDTALIKDVHVVDELYGCRLDWCADVKRVFITDWIPRAVRVFGVHVKHKLFGHDWWK